MGTETLISHYGVFLQVFRHVKLNNPQMGTETIQVYNYKNYHNLLVKFIDPLMGTETH